MTQFIDVNEPTAAPVLSTVAMRYNGLYLEDLIEGYNTLTVTGRETISHNMNTQGKSETRHGEKLASKTMPARKLEITYQLSAPNGQAFQSRFRQLMAALHTEADAVILFNDDPAIEYRGQLSEMAEIPGDSNTVTGSFTIFCQDPLKYATSTTTTNAAGVITIPTGAGLPMYDVTPDLITLTPVANMLLSAQTVAVTNARSGRKIVLDFDETAGETSPSNPILINIKSGTITTAAGSLMKFIRFEESDFHAFTVKPGDVVVVDPGAAVVEDTTPTPTPTPTGPVRVIVYHIDEYGDTITAPVEIRGEIGEPYFAENISDAQYEVSAVSGPTEGVLTAELIEVTYSYTTIILEAPADPPAGDPLPADPPPEQFDVFTIMIDVKGSWR